MQLYIGSDGNNIVLPAATSTLWGVMSPAQAAAITLSTAFQPAVNLNTARTTALAVATGSLFEASASFSTRVTLNDAKVTNVSTNLTATTHASQITINSSDGTNVVIAEASDTIAGLMTTTHHDKLDGIESSATADQSNAEIRTAVEAATDSNVFTDADHTKLDGIEASATADQTQADINGLAITTVGTLGSLTMGGDINTDDNNIDAGSGQISAISFVGQTFEGPGNSDLDIKSDGNITFVLDDDNDETAQKFIFKNDTIEIATLNESGSLQLDGDITASGNISSSGNITAKKYHADLGTSNGYGIGDPSSKPVLSLLSAGTPLRLGANHSSYVAAGVNIYTTGSDATKGLFLDSVGNITASGDISASGDVTANNLTVISKTYEYATSGYSGDVVSFGTGPSGVNGNIIAGELYYLDSTQQWEKVDADAESTSTNLLGIAVANGTATFLVKGIIANSAYAGFTTGAPLYVSTTLGDMSSTAPSGTGDIVRVVGHSINGSGRVLFFNPSNDWIEIA
jgi:hypothetical protein